MRAAAAAALSLLLCGACAASPPADAEVGCTLKSRPSVTVNSLKQLPKQIREALDALAGAMADRGEFWNATDVMQKPAPFQRFIRGGKIGARWFIWYEHGGIAYWKQLVVFEAAAPNGSRSTIFNAPVHGDLCAATDQAMATPPVPPNDAAE